MASLAPRRPGGDGMTTDRATAWMPDLHHRLARRYTLDLRATRAAAAALAGSIVGWLAGLDPGVHATVIVIAAAIGAAIPTRAPLERAFGWIGRESGLAYQTHVEHEGRADPYGLLAEAAVQARLTIRGVSAPPRSPWWLPLAATAVAVWLVATVIGGPGAFGAGPQGPSGTAPQPSPPPVAAPQTEPDAEEPSEGEDVPEEPEAASPPSDPGRDGADPADAAASEGTEGEAVERFLDNLRERPAVAEERAAVEAAREAPRDGVGDDDRDGEVPDEVAREVDRDVEGTLRPDPREPDEDAETVETDVPGAGDRDEREPGDEEGDQEGAGGDGEEGDDGRPGEEGDGDAGDEGEDGDGEGQREAGAPGDDDTGFDAGEGDDAGIGRGAPAETEGAELDSEGEPEALPGMLLPGEETPGGRVRLPGRDDGHLPEGAAVERYERAVEQAVTDGAVPVPYQEIIRNYFR
jgi:hypothetical protein